MELKNLTKESGKRVDPLIFMSKLRVFVNKKRVESLWCCLPGSNWPTQSDAADY